MEGSSGGFKNIDDKSYQPENFVIDIEIVNCGWKHTNTHTHTQTHIYQHILLTYIKNLL